jgi:DNA-binding NtrC family response regulator
VPPLRERAEDIVPLAEHFLKQSNLNRHFSSEAFHLLQQYGWPGNVRELRNVVTKAAVLAREAEIAPGDLLLAPQRAAPESAPVATLPTANLDGMEKTTILRVLAQTNGHQQRAAELLGISRRTLSRKLKLYGREAVRESFAS